MIPLWIALGALCGAASVELVGTYGGIWERQSIIASACKNRHFAGVFLGNSVAMNGVDTKVISEQLLPHETFYNFSSGGQGLLESLSIMDHLPSECKIVAWGILPLAFESEHDVPQDVWAKYYFSDLEPSDTLLHFVEKIHAPSTSEYFDQPDFQRAFHSRWIYRSILDTSIRQFLRKDLDLGRADRDLFYPSPYTKHLPETKKQVLIERMKKDLLSSSFSGKLSKDFLELMNYFVRDNQARHRQGTLVIMPMRPEILDTMGRDKVRSAIEKLKAEFPELPILDLHEYLESSRFVDLMHPDREGAIRISKELSSFLQKTSHTKSEQL